MIISKIIFLFLYLTILPSSFGNSEEDYYQLLGVEKNADVVIIRKAFKKLVITKHPDKNPDDPDAHDNFLKLAEAYDVLKDTNKREQYDKYGKKAFEKNSTPQYHSYTYYRDHFGIYDDDPLVITLGRDDFKNSIGNGIWFINFYSPLCSHCHHLAPEWRELSKILEGVINIGAMNCEDERNLCLELSIRRYPTLLFYKEKVNVYSGEDYFEKNVARDLEKFVMSQISETIKIHEITVLPDSPKIPWVLFLDSVPIDYNSYEQYKRIKLAATLKGIVSVGYVENDNLIKELVDDATDNKILWQPTESKKVITIHGDTHKLLADDILQYIPEVSKLNEEEFQKIRTTLRNGNSLPWLICFSLDADTQKSVMLKRLKGTLDEFNIGEIDCAKNSGLCSSLYINRYPTWGILKKTGTFEVHTGQSSLYSIETFARNAKEATNLQALSPQDLQKIMSEDSPWLIGWLLTGCPPCKKILPALRRASIFYQPHVIKFGTVDCAQHSHICSQYNIHRYPTTTLYNGSSILTFSGESTGASIIEFISTMRANDVITLNDENFESEVGQKPESILYAVHFYGPWCYTCQKLHPEWIKVAKQLSGLKNVKIGSVNCDLENDLCVKEGVRDYPVFRLYPFGSFGKRTVGLFQNRNKDFNELRKWVLSFIPSPVTELNRENFYNHLLSNKEDRTWVVLFYAPWCGYCHVFEPEFFIATEKLKNIVVAGKVNCQIEGALCMQEQIQSYPSVILYQRLDGVTSLTSGIMLGGHNQEALYTEMKSYAANAYITPVEHDEL